MSISISASVGFAGRNKPTDVALVQQLLNTANNNHALTVDGLTGKVTRDAIKAFQKDKLKSFNPDSLISPHARTFKLLKTFYKITPSLTNHSTFGIRADRFATLYQKQFSALKPASQTGLRTLCNFILADKEITDLRWAAYMLATTKRETAHTMLPIKEYGKGKTKPYGNEVSVTDKKGKIHKNIYFGRGYVQLTWDHNYQSMSNNLKMGEELYIYPDKALDQDTAYQIMSYGMRKGSFTSRNLSRYISGIFCDYVNARRIINGTDKAQLIADYAIAIESLLRLSRTKIYGHPENLNCLTTSTVCAA